MKFSLEIQMGNDAMQTGHDVAMILHHVGTVLASEYAYDRFDETVSGARLRDMNGATVGRWEVVPS